MTDTLISFETAKLAKEKGFNTRSEPFRYHVIEERLTLLEGINAPTQSLLQKWLRETHNMSIETSCTIVKNWFYEIYEISSGDLLTMQTTKHCDTYEEALEQGLINALNMIP